MVKAVVVYDTEFGNTERIAKVLAEGMEEQGVDVECVEVEEVEIDKLTEHDLLVIGGPTHMHNMSKPVKEFLEKLETEDVRGMKVFAFDTRAKRAFAESAAKRVERRLKRLQMSIIRPYSSALVKKRGGSLEEDMEKMFKHISAELADLVQQQSSSELENQLAS